MLTKPRVSVALTTKFYPKAKHQDTESRLNFDSVLSPYRTFFSAGELEHIYALLDYQLEVERFAKYCLVVGDPCQKEKAKITNIFRVFQDRIGRLLNLYPFMENGDFSLLIHMIGEPLLIETPLPALVRPEMIKIFEHLELYLEGRKELHLDTWKIGGCIKVDLEDVRINPSLTAKCRTRRKNYTKGNKLINRFESSIVLTREF